MLEVSKSGSGIGIEIGLEDVELRSRYGCQVSEGISKQ